MKLFTCAGLPSLVSRCLCAASLLRSGFIGEHSGGAGTLPSRPTTVEGMAKFVQAPALLRAQPGKRGGRPPPHLCHREQTLSIFLLRLQPARAIYPDFTPSTVTKGWPCPSQTGWQQYCPQLVPHIKCWVSSVLPIHTHQIQKLHDVLGEWGLAHRLPSEETSSLALWNVSDKRD